MIRIVPLSIIRSSSLYTQQWFRPDPARKLSTNLYEITMAAYTVKNSWWWTEELSETC